MGQKSNPIGLRLQINRTWDSRWYAEGADYGRLLLEDLKIRAFIMKTLPQAAISKVVIERPAKLGRNSIFAARPGVIIGKKGTDIEKLKKTLSSMTSSDVSLNIVEIRKPEIDAKLVAQGEQARVIHVAPTKLIMVDNEIALMPLTVSQDTVESAVVVRSSAMLAALGRIFDDMWRFAAPFTAAQDLLSGQEMQPTEEERWILSLLASGATDDTIGRLMGFSARTAHRRVRELIARLGVETRFQAGMQAVKLGWL